MARIAEGSKTLMRNLISTIVQFLRGLFPRRKTFAKREIALLATDPDLGSSLVDRLFVRPDGSTAVPATPGGEDDAEEGKVRPDWHVLSSSQSKRGRGRWWNIYAPSWDIDSAGPDRGRWQEICDTFIVALHGKALHDKSQMARIEAHVPLSVGIGSKSGRLKRAGVVITGLPANSGLCHASQVRLSLPGRRSVAETVRALLDGTRQPGDPLADSRWKQALQQTMGGGKALPALVDTLQISLGKKCPVFFLPGESCVPNEDSPVVRWIAGRREKPLVRWRDVAMVTAATAVLAFATVLWADLPRGLRHRPLDPANPESVLRTRAQLVQARGDLGDGGTRMMRSVVDGTASWVDIDRAVDYLESLTKLGDLTAGLRDRVDRVQALYKSMLQRVGSGQSAFYVAETTHARVNEEIRLHAAWLRDDAPALAPGHATLMDEWRDALARASVLRVLFATQISGGAPGLTRIDESTVSRFAEWMESLVLNELRAALLKVYEKDDPLFFYRTLYELASNDNPAVSTSVRHAWPHLPRPKLTLWVEEALAWDLQTTFDHQDELKARLEYVKALHELALDGSGLVRAELARALVEALERLMRALTLRVLELRFVITGDSPSWHLDVRRSSKEDRIGLPAPVEGTVGWRVANASFNSSIRLTLNPANAYHVAPAGEPCTKRQEKAFRLRSPSNLLSLDGGIVAYEVTSGWPDWPPIQLPPIEEEPS